MGTVCDPSENWEHTIKIIKNIENCNKEIVVICKHWTNLTDSQLSYLSTQNICINTSVSAMDKHDILSNSLKQYERLKPFVKSALRIVSCNFNINNYEGRRLSEIQSELFKNDNVIDTVFRFGKNNALVKDGVIIPEKINFMGKTQLGSKFKKSTYTGKCSTCFEMCGARMNIESPTTRKGIIEQKKFFK